jgi:glycosyltransferase involved in cell wall biosynthesis
MKKDLTLIICTLNEEENLEFILNALTVNTQDYDIIIVDGGSIDKTREIAESYSDVKFVTRKGVGLLFQRMYGIQITNTKYFAFIDADDLISSADIIKGLLYLKINHLDGIQFKTTSRVLNNNYWQKVWAAYFKTIYIDNQSITMLGRPCLSKTFFYKDLILEKVYLEDTYLNKVLLGKFGVLNYKVAPYFSYRLCEDSVFKNWNKWFGYGKGDSEITKSFNSFLSSFYHLFFRILIYRSLKILFSKNIFYFPGILFFSIARLLGFFKNLNFNKLTK